MVSRATNTKNFETDFKVSSQTLETDSFISALKCFMARHGKPKEMRSNNDTNFKGGNRELMDAVKQWNHDKLNTFFL